MRSHGTRQPDHDSDAGIPLKRQLKPVLWVMFFSALAWILTLLRRLDFVNEWFTTNPIVAEIHEAVKYLSIVIVFSAGWVIAWVSTIRPALKSAPEALGSLSEIRDSIQDIQEQVTDLHGRNPISTTVLDPQRAGNFESLFSRAVSIRAYNPPLSLLENSQSHRSALYDALRRIRACRMIVGREGRKRLLRIAEHWEDHRTASGVTKQGHASRFKKWEVAVVLGDDEKCDLHSNVTGLPFFEQIDVRGFSYFLIEESGAKFTAVLYILGAPFVADFDVPSLAISVSGGDRESNDICRELSESFDSRWNRLKARRGQGHDVLGVLQLKNSDERRA